MTTKFQQLDTVMKENWPEVYMTLRHGSDVGLSRSNPCQDWFEWKNGQEHDVVDLLIGRYRFIPFSEARASCSELRRGPALQVSALLIFAPRMLVSWPLLIDAAGDGYYFNTIRKRVFWHFEGSPDMRFRSFGVFVDFLIALLSISRGSERTLIEREIELVQKCTQ